MRDISNTDFTALGEALNTAVGWLLGMTFVALLITVLVERVNLKRKSPKSLNKEDEINER